MDRRIKTGRVTEGEGGRERETDRQMNRRLKTGRVTEREGGSERETHTHRWIES